jgi:hypothetical protein
MVWPFQIPEAVWCLVRGHDPLLEHRHDAQGEPEWPPVLHWVCSRCRRDLGDSVLRIDVHRPNPKEVRRW